MLCFLLAATMNPSPETLWRQIEADYAIPGTPFLRESKADGHPVFNWGLGVVLSVETALGNRDRLRKRLEMAEQYWNPAGPVPGFDVQPGPKFPQDRYYDDNAWMVIAYVEAYEVLGERRWLDRARYALTYVLSGESDQLGGGIYWRERDKASKNTCSNGPSAAAALAVYRHTRERELLRSAVGLYAWTMRNLQDPSDGLFWDNLDLNGCVEKTKWSYNTALMLRTARELASITGQPRYARDAQRMSEAAHARWVRADGTIDDELPFAHLLFENLELSSEERSRAVERLLAGRSVEGRFGVRWGVVPGPGDKGSLLAQASAIRALTISARYPSPDGTRE